MAIIVEYIIKGIDSMPFIEGKDRNQVNLLPDTKMCT